MDLLVISGLKDPKRLQDKLPENFHRLRRKYTSEFFESLTKESVPSPLYGFNPL